jgi:cell division protein FtsN
MLPPEEALAWKGGALDGAAPAQEGAARALPEVPAAARPGETYRIQVASYGDAANARATVERLEAAGLSPAIETAGGYQRVVFLGLGEEAARTIAARLDLLGYRGYTVVRIRPAGP